MKLQKIFAAVVAGALAASAMVAAAYAGEKTLSEVQYTGIKVTGTFEAGSAISGTERLKIKITDKNGLTITGDEFIKTAITAKTIAKAANIEATFSLDSGKASASKLEGMKFEISYSVDGTADPAVYTKIDVPMTKELQGADYVAPASWTLNGSVISDKNVKTLVDADEGLTVTVNHKKADAGKEIKYKVDGGAEVTKAVAKDATSTVIEIKPDMVDVNVFSGLVTRKNPTFEITSATVDEITSVVLSWEDEAPATEAPVTEPPAGYAKTKDGAILAVKDYLSGKTTKDVAIGAVKAYIAG